MSLEQQNTVAVVGLHDDGSVEVFDEKQLLFDVADKMLGDSLEAGSLQLVEETLRRFRNLGYASAISTAKILHGVNKNWQEWEHESEDTFVAWAVREVGLDALTVKKRVCEWEMLRGNYIPKPHREKISEYNIRQLDKVYSICVSSKENKGGGYLNFIEEDYDISEGQWLQLAEAVDEEMVGEVVREIKGKEKNSNHMSIKIDDDGTLWVYQGQSAETVGQLFVEKEVEVVQKAIRRICSNSGITERNDY